MTTIYVYTPVTGYVSGLKDKYCKEEPPSGIFTCCCKDTQSHPAVIGHSPLDIATSPASQAVWFECWPTPGSLKRTFLTGTSSCSCAGSPWKNVVSLEMWTGPNASGSRIGTVYYSHVQNPATNLTINNEDLLLIGFVPTSLPGCGCYGGPHSHVSVGNGIASGVLNSAVNSCCKYVTSGGYVHSYFTY